MCLAPQWTACCVCVFPAQVRARSYLHAWLLAGAQWMWVDSLTHHRQSSKLLGLRVCKGLLQWLFYLPLKGGQGRKNSPHFAHEAGGTWSTESQTLYFGVILGAVKKICDTWVTRDSVFDGMGFCLGVSDCVCVWCVCVCVFRSAGVSYVQQSLRIAGLCQCFANLNGQINHPGST